MVILFRDLELELGSEPLNGLKIFSEEKYTGSNGGVNFLFSLYDMFSPFFTDKNFLNYQFGRQQVDYGFGKGIEIIKNNGSFSEFEFQYNDKTGHRDKSLYISNDISNLSYLDEFREFLNYDILDVLYRYDIKKVWCGHLHNLRPGSFSEHYLGIDVKLVSADYAEFVPQRVV